MQMKILKLTADNNITVHDYPKGGNYREQNTALSDLIGDGCELVEEVRPQMLYEKFNFSNVATENEGDSICMLIDEDGLFKKKININPIASYLYECGKHGFIIAGNVLFVGEKTSKNKVISYCGLSEKNFIRLKKYLEIMANGLNLEV